MGGRGRGGGGSRTPSRQSSPVPQGAIAKPEDANKYAISKEEIQKLGLPVLTHNRVRTKSTDVQLGLAAFRIVERNIPGVDDPVYEKNRDVWEAVPRGCAVVFAQGADGSFTRIASLNGARKFGYTESPYGYRSDVTTVVGIEKENGECGHLAAFTHGGQNYWMAGSKHVHIIFRASCAASDINQYTDPMRYKVAKKIAHMWLDQLKKMDPRKNAAFHKHLAETQQTACFEAIFADSQHIVDYQGATEMRFFACARNCPSSEELVVDWNESDAMFKSFGLPVAEISQEYEYKSEAYNQYLDVVARRINSEGVVMYGKNKDGKVCCMWKEKAYPYVMERVAREAIKRGQIRDLLLATLKRRLNQQNKAVREYFSAWETTRMPYLVHFASWLHYTKRWTTDEWALSTRWLTLQNEFNQADDGEKAEAEKVKLQDISGKQLSEVVMCVGPPGSGKSTLSRTMYGLLQQANLRPRWLNQDESGSRQKYLINVKKANEDPTTTHLLLDKVNVGWGNRSDYLQMGITPTVTVLFAHPDGIDAMEKVCVDRVMNRGEKHRTLRVAEGERDAAVKVFQDIMSGYDAPEDASVVSVDVCAPFEDSIRAVWKALADNTTFSDLPAIEALDVDSALEKARNYESLLSDYGEITHNFAAVQIKTNQSELLKLIPEEALANKTLREAFHITLKFFGGEMDPIWFAEVAAVVGQSVDVTVEEVVYDEKGVALTVSGPFRSANKTPHVTIACAPGVAPVYSNQMINGGDAFRHKCPPGTKILGQFALM